MITMFLARVRTGCPVRGSTRAAGLAAALAVTLGAALGALAAGDLRITVIDVGQGDATLVQSPSGKTLLFDGGDNGKGSAVVVPFLQAAGIDTLDYIVVSHYHADHIGGLDEVLASIPVKVAAYDRGYNYSTATYTAYTNAAGVKRTTITPGQVIDLGEGVTATCVALNGNGVLAAPFDNDVYENEYDVCLKVEYGGFDYLQAGDLTGNTDSGSKDIETGVGSLAGDVDVYHVNHHGSYTSSIAAFLSSLQAQTAVISVGSNSYGHPHQVVLDRLQSAGIFTYQTEAGSGGTLPADDLRVVGGHVAIVTDGIEVYTVAGDSWALDESGASPAALPPLASLVVLGNHPNPFNPYTLIAFDVPGSGSAALEVFDVAGRRILVRDFAAQAGLNQVGWDGRDGQGRPVPSGVYLYRIRTGPQSAGGRMVLAR